jgi:transcriptional regulator with XRE-family HTH domain
MDEVNSLKVRRIQRGLSQAALAASVGISQQLMSKLEKGTISMTPERAQTFAAILGCKAIDLLPAFANQPTPEGAEETELVQLYRAIDTDQRRILMQIARTLRMENAARPMTSAIAN